MEKLLTEILSQQATTTAITVVITTFCSYLTYAINRKIKADEEYQRRQKELARSNKRGNLRNEYLQIYNSTEFSWEEKYHMTRDIIRDYYNLEGNHYIHHLDDELAIHMTEEKNSK